MLGNADRRDPLRGVDHAEDVVVLMLARLTSREVPVQPALHGVLPLVSHFSSAKKQEGTGTLENVRHQ